RRQTGVARTYLEEAVRRARDAEHRKRIQAEVGLLYAQNNADDEAEKIWQGILKEDPAHGPAHLYMAVLSTRQGNSALQKKHFQQAEAWARANHDADFLEQVKQFRQM